MRVFGWVESAWLVMTYELMAKVISSLNLSNYMYFKVQKNHCYVYIPNLAVYNPWST